MAVSKSPVTIMLESASSTEELETLRSTLSPLQMDKSLALATMVLTVVILTAISAPLPDPTVSGLLPTTRIR